MTDRWGRPTGPSARGDPADAPSSVDVPLVGADTTAVARPADRPPTDGRRLVRIALAGVVALGVGIAVVRSGSDDGDTAGPVVNTSDAVIPAITTPPTLRPLDTLPPPDLHDAPADEPEPRSKDATTGTAEGSPPLAPVVVPTYAPVPDVAPGGFVADDIATVIARNDDDIARQSDTHVELGRGGFVLDVSIVRDPERDRYLLEFESRGVIEVAIVDVATGTTYIDPGTADETRIANGDITGDIGTNEYFDRLLRGPVRSDTYDPVATRARGIVTVDAVGDAREFITRIDGELAPEWQIYAFGPVGEFLPSDRPEVLDYSVYVDAQGRIVQVDGVSMLGNVPQLVRHRLRVLDEPTAIDLPDVVATSPDTAVDEADEADEAG